MSCPNEFQIKAEGSCSSRSCWGTKQEGIHVTSLTTSNSSADQSVLLDWPDAGCDQKVEVVKNVTPPEFMEVMPHESNGMNTATNAVSEVKKSSATSNALTSNGYLRTESNVGEMTPFTYSTWGDSEQKNSLYSLLEFTQKQEVKFGANADVFLSTGTSSGQSTSLTLLSEIVSQENWKASAKSFLSKNASGVVDSFLNESNLWKCPICSKLLTRQSCRSHLQIHADEKPFKCDKCDMEFRAKRSLDDHSVAHRFVGSTNPLQCRLCDKVLSSLKCLARHKMIHTGEKPYKCEKCDKGYRTNDQLTNHVASHGDERNRLKCELCHLAYWTKSELCRHIRRRHSNQPRPMHKCHLCIKAYVKKTSLNEHIKRHEGIADIFKCEDCGKVYSQRSSLLTHMNKKHNHSEKLYKCQECDRWFSARHMLKSHIKLAHSESPRERRYKCEDCSQTFVYMCKLKEHMNIHLNAKPYTCDVCGKSFTRETNLQQHVVIHSDVKKFKCDLCDKAFSWPSHLTSHMRGHLGVKPHQCEKCGKSFSERSSLRLHMRSSHQTELPYTNNRALN